MTQQELDEYNALYDELIQSRDEVADLRECYLARGIEQTEQKEDNG